ncbi:10489_t:CDS:2 [Funneliformis geosporum]|nr:10489_t:CDS:2 [Funneliformis geosporum]
MRIEDEITNMNDDKLTISDYITMFVDTYLLPDLNHLQGIAGHIMAIFLNIILISVRYSGYRDNPSQKENPLQDGFDEINIKCEEYIDKYSTITYVLLISNEPLNIPHANLVCVDLPWYARNRLGYYIHQQIYELNYDKPYEEGQKVWEICVWNPNKFCLNLLCGFSPVQVSILMLMNKDTWIPSIMLAGLLALQMYFYTDKFISLLLDKEIIFREVQHEYDTKFVKPSIFRQKKNFEIQSTPQEEIIKELLRPRLVEERRYGKFDNPWAS